MKSNTRVIKQVVVLGGGTAGWLSACHLAKKLLPNHPDGIRVMLVDSPDIPTVGVGEGTVPAIRESLQYLGISETDLLQTCDATFKQSIQFINWQPPMADGKMHSYHHVFDYPAPGFQQDLPYWALGHAGDSSFADSFSIQSSLCDAQLAPKLITQPEYQGTCNYAYHFDAGKFGKLLCDHGVNKLGVEHRQAKISLIETDEQGNISALVTDKNERISGDFFVDCSGSQSILLGKTLQVPFVSKKHMLFTDTALAVQVPYSKPTDEIPSCTLATAQTAGWIWDIGLTSRRGVGLVYSSAHLSDSEAELQLAEYLKGTNGQRVQVEPRKIPMRTGYHQEFWKNNCVAIGLSQGFVEPLEATGLLLFDISARMLAENFPSHQELMPLAANKFNKKVRLAWDKVLDFIKLHYCISQREDSDFWQDHRQSSSMSEQLAEDLARWQWQLPNQYDFTERAAIFNLENYLYVLYGMNFKTDLSQSAYRFEQVNVAKTNFQRYADMAAQAKQQLPGHRDLLDRIQRFGLQRI
ncbi:tryptophan halogenase family protein [Aliiglaciecola lipolytica]|uniref:Tryptophan halogenase n=1 Tax=Aliiglaciecola lipolytica E3 TaxID=1127673 RepID=K6YIZ1_9ALTE|nr:tryptophan halogenase family protein [Aliiglaciecola lipolytica]GAC16593.1 tryptophan halogenase [Aliiglaciecola lipolytica E3]